MLKFGVKFSVVSFREFAVISIVDSGGINSGINYTMKGSINRQWNYTEKSTAESNLIAVSTANCKINAGPNAYGRLNGKIYSTIKCKINSKVKSCNG